MTRPKWYDNKWGRVKALVRDLENDYQLSNKQVQDKIIEILEEKTQ
jgi:hypothetical protein